MSFRTERHDEVKAIVLTVDGDIDISVVPAIRTALDETVDAGYVNIVFDLSGVAYADSSALGLLVWLNRRIAGLDGRIVLSGANRDINRILELSGLVSLAETVSSTETTADALGGLEVIETSDEPLWVERRSFVADVEMLGAAREGICQLIVPLGFSDAALFDIKVALGEALANAVRHGTPDSSDHVDVRVSAFKSRVVLEVEDKGMGFDGEHEKAADLYASGGRGVMFMRALMDDVRFTPSPGGGTCVTLVKRCSSVAGTAEAP